MASANGRSFPSTFSQSVDNSTPNADDDTERMPNYPIITAAHYDPATDRTTVSGINPSKSSPTRGNQFRIELYANATGDAPQARTFLGSFFVGQGPFQVNVRRDLRGQFLTATTIRFRQSGFSTQTEETSEIGPAARVD